MNNKTKMEILKPLIEATGKESINTLYKFLHERISHPDSYIVFLGETSSGKSTIINSLLESEMLPMSSCPSTAAITEIELTDQIDSDEYYAINKNATMEALDCATFQTLCIHPDDRLQRLRLRHKTTNQKLRYARIFDTPGYGSIIEKHEEVLKEFIPNGDIIIYTVDYKKGIQNDDYTFMNFLKSLIREDVEIMFVINKCPPNCNGNNSRIAEIKKYATGILAKEPLFMFIETTKVRDDDTRPLPQCSVLNEEIGRIISSDERNIKMDDVFNSYIRELYEICDNEIQSRYHESLLSEECYLAVKEECRKYAQNLRKAIPDIIEPGFRIISDALPSKFSDVSHSLKNELEKEIEKQEKTKKEETVAYINHHLLPYSIQLATRETIEHYIEVEINDINKKVEDYIVNETIKFNNNISVRLESNIETTLKNGILKDFGEKAGLKYLSGYFMSIGGAGGVGAGVANAASHSLKRVGDIFGHTFSRETHNALKHGLKKIGATSARAVNIAVIVIFEAMSIVVDLNTWKPKLKKKIAEGLEKWQSDALRMVTNDIDNLKKTNIDLIEKIAKDWDSQAEKDKPTDSESWIEKIELSQSLGKTLGYIN